LGKKMTKTEVAQIPPEIRELWGEPPLLSSEDLKAYDKLARTIIKDVAPTDVIEWLWIKDVLDLSWEVRRLRRFKITLIELKRDDELRESENMDQARNYMESEQGETELFLDNLGDWEKIDQLLTMAEARRITVLREIERRRESFADRLRKASSDIIEGECEEHHLASESGRRSEDDAGAPQKPADVPKPGVPRLELLPRPRVRSATNRAR
jgi:hypothetical protein